jgi:hypothetical protein
MNRQHGGLTVQVERSATLAARSVDVSLTPRHATEPSHPMIELPAGSSGSVTFDDVRPGYAELRLHDDVFDSYSERQGVVRERCRRTARSLVAGIADGGIEPLKKQLAAAKGVAVEPAFARLLFLLGWSPLQLDRNATQPTGLPDGLMRFDVLAFGRHDSVLLAAECSSDWLGDDKLAKLVTRTRELSEVLKAGLAPSDVPRVQPALVVTKPKAVAPPHLLQAAEHHAVGIIAQEDLLELLAYVAADEPEQALVTRFAACFPQGSWLGPPNAAYEFGKYDVW